MTETMIRRRSVSRREPSALRVLSGFPPQSVEVEGRADGAKPLRNLPWTVVGSPRLTPEKPF